MKQNKNDNDNKNCQDGQRWDSLEQHHQEREILWRNRVTPTRTNIDDTMARRIDDKQSLASTICPLQFHWETIPCSNFSFDCSVCEDTRTTNNIWPYLPFPSLHFSNGLQFVSISPTANSATTLEYTIKAFFSTHEQGHQTDEQYSRQHYQPNEMINEEMTQHPKR